MNSQGTLLDFIEYASQSVAIDWRKAAEAHYALLCGYSENVVEPFTRDRIFWLMDSCSGWLTPPPR